MMITKKCMWWTFFFFATMVIEKNFAMKSGILWLYNSQHIREKNYDCCLVITPVMLFARKKNFAKWFMSNYSRPLSENEISSKSHSLLTFGLRNSKTILSKMLITPLKTRASILFSRILFASEMLPHEIYMEFDSWKNLLKRAFEKHVASVES